MLRLPQGGWPRGREAMVRKTDGLLAFRVWGSTRDFQPPLCPGLERRISAKQGNQPRIPGERGMDGR